MDDFIEATTLEPIEGSRFRVTLLEDWALWGPAGGYVAAIALRAAGMITAHTRPVSFCAQYLRMARFETIDVAVTSMKTGRRTEALRVDLVQDGKAVLTAQVWAMTENAGMAHDYVSRPTIPDPASLKSWEELYPDRPVHPFMRKMEQRPLEPVPEEDLTPREPELESLFRFRPTTRADDPFVDAARVLLLIDTYSWLATYPAHPSPGASPWIAPNLDLYVRFHRDTTMHEWLYCRARADLAEDGLIATEGWIHGLDGSLLATGASQLFCSPRPDRLR